MAILFGAGRFKATDKDNSPISGAFLSFYATLTSTFQPVYSDPALTTALTNPVKADSNGLFPEIWLDDSLPPYKVVHSSPDVNNTTIPGSTIWSIQQYNAPVSADHLVSLLNPITESETSAGVTIMDHSYREGYVERYGADPTGVLDSGPAFRAACEVMLVAGGGIIYATGSLYNFTTWDPISFYGANNLALFCLPGNTELSGGGMFHTKLRISAAARSGMYSGGINRSHIIGMRAGQLGQYVHDIQFDWNGIVQASATDYCYHLRSMDGGCIIERCYGTQAPISNGIAFGSNTAANACVLRDCIFTDSGPNMSGNSINADCSYVYNGSNGSVFENNKIYNTSNASKNCGGMEMHASHYNVRYNYLNNLQPAMYIGVQDAVTQSVDSIIESNTFSNSFGGIEFIDSHYGLRIINNLFQSCADKTAVGFADIFSPLSATDGTNSAGIQQEILISGNIFERLLYRDGTSQGDTGSISINLSHLDGVHIHNNIFNAGTTAIQISGTSSGTTQRVSIEDNILSSVGAGGANSGYFQILASSGAGWVSVGTISDVYIRRNKIFRDRGLSTSTAYELVATNAGAGPSCTFTNVRYENNEATSSVLSGVLGNGASSVCTGYHTPTYGATVTPDASIGTICVITATNGTAFTIANVANAGSISIPARTLLTICVRNTSGGSLGTITWGASYRLATFTAPANGNSRSITFAYEAGLWIEVNRTSADIPN